MDHLKRVLASTNEDLEDDDFKEDIFQDLISIQDNEKIDKKHLKRVFKVTLKILKFKGEQVISLLQDLDAKDGEKDEEGQQEDEAILKGQIEKLSKVIEKHEIEKNQLKTKIKELSEEVVLFQKRLQESSHLGSENEDSPDALSEIDKQQELMSNITMKNKHIKRLLRDIEDLEKRSTKQVNLIQELRFNLNDSTQNVVTLSNQLTESKGNNKQLEDEVSKLNNIILELEEQNKQLKKEKEERQFELESFSKELQKRIDSYQKILYDKQEELNAANQRYHDLIANIPGYKAESESSDEYKNMVESIKDRDSIIKNLEKKISQLTNELFDSTNVIKKFNEEKDEYVNRLLRNKNEQCCKEEKIMLEKSHERCKELQDMLTFIEDDNLLKSKQAFEAIEALRSYENNEDGLSVALKKIHQLQESLHRKDKQIQELVHELNSANEVAAENYILRKKLGIPEDEIIHTKSFFAKQRKFAKINERLLLKLQASEEMRLQLKIDKNDLRRKIAKLKEQLAGRQPTTQSGSESENQDQQSTHESEENFSRGNILKRDSSTIQLCENCQSQYSMLESIKFCRGCIAKQNMELVKKIQKLEVDHKNVMEENDNLRLGMQEILEKLRDYEGSSKNQTLNPSTLEKLLYILKLRHSNVNFDTVDFTNNLERPSSGEKGSGESTDSQEILGYQNQIERLKGVIVELSEKNENLNEDLSELQTVKNQYNELLNSLNLSEDEREKLFIDNLQRCLDIEVSIKNYERKVEFLKNENDQFFEELKMLKSDQITLMHELKLEMSDKNKMIEELKLNSPKLSEDEINEDFGLENFNCELQQIKVELSGLCFNILKNIKTIDIENLLNIDLSNFENVTLLENNLSTSLITREEYNNLKNENKKLQSELEKCKLNEKFLEELAKITQSQLLSQQQMIAKISDDEILTRHLLVDLQAKNNDNYLLTKAQRELNLARMNEEQLKNQIDELKKDISNIKNDLGIKEKELLEKEDKIKLIEFNGTLKIRYLKKTLLHLCDQYSNLTPSFFIMDFVRNYVTLLDLKKDYELKLLKLNREILPELSTNEIVQNLKSEFNLSVTDIQHKVDTIKYKSKCEYLKLQLDNCEQTISNLQIEVENLKLKDVQNKQHWNTIKVLFDEENGKDSPQHEKSTVIEKFDKAIMVCPEINTIAVNTEPQDIPQNNIPTVPVVEENLPVITIPTEIPCVPISPEKHPVNQQKSLESQLKQAMVLANTRSILLIETENHLNEAQGRIKVLEKSLEEKDKLIKKGKQSEEEVVRDDPRKCDNIMSITIATLQNLLLEKDTTLSRYQELLKTERQQNTRAYEDQLEEIKSLKQKIDNLEDKIKESSILTSSMTTKIDEYERKIRETNVEMLQERRDDSRALMELKNMELKLETNEIEMKRMQMDINDLRMKEKLMKDDLKEKDGFIRDLHEKLKIAHENIESLTENRISTTEIDQLREMLEEKDRHIQDLTETLNQFHDDQQKYFDDTTLNSTEQVTQMSADLNRAEATNRILRTQLDALKRQITNISQREKQARDMMKTLKTQLIRRPVISVKADKKLTNTNREEQLQRKIHQLENEILDLKDELRKQININDNKKAKNAAELGLWDKQKRFQELSEKLRAKLTEKEIDFERLKANYTAAKNTITRFEKEKHILENRIKSGRYYAGNNFCANCNHQHLTKYTPAETPDSYTGTGTASEISSVGDLALNEGGHEMLNILKARVESQQRKIVALELEGKGSNAVTLEMERLQEKLSAIESQNIRLEAKNVQLQLDIDLYKQDDSGDRLKRQIKHLEEYILVLKDELSQAHAKSVPKDSAKQSDGQSSTIHQMEQTILTLKRVIERLKSENKYLKDSNKNAPTSSQVKTSKRDEFNINIKNDYEKLQKIHNETLDKISALQVELELQQSYQINFSCPHCNKKNSNDFEIDNADLTTQLQFVKDQLQQKTHLLEKAKILLTRAAAKERQLREQIAYFKRRCCELQNIPIIEETSE